MTRRVMQCDSYLFTFQEAARIFRVNYQKFQKDFISTGRIKITKIESGTFIQHRHIREFLDENVYVYEN